MAEQLVLKESILHEESVKNIRVKEDFFSDGRSYVSEQWAWEGTTSVTYYFAVDGIEENKSALEEYLVSVDKLIHGPIRESDMIEIGQEVVLYAA